MTKPDLRPRPPFALWLFERGIFDCDAAAAIGCSAEWVRRINLPFDDVRRARPSGRLRERIAAYTEGAIGLLDWDPKSQAVAA